MPRKKQNNRAAIGVALGVGALALAFAALQNRAAVPTAAESQRVLYLYGLAHRALGINNPPRLQYGNVPNAAYDAASNRITINIVWFREMLTKYCDDEVCALTVVTGILGHELGHSLQRQTLLAFRRGRPMGVSHRLELQADEYAGYVLGRIGLDSGDLEHVIQHMAGVYDTGTHPAGPARAAAIARGYWRGAFNALAAK
jgi:hypothetical protein